MILKVSKNYKLRFDGNCWAILVRNASIKAGETICHICGKELERLTPLHAKTSHDMTWEEFLEDRQRENGEGEATEKWVPRLYYVTLEGAIYGLMDLKIGEREASSLKELTTTIYEVRKELINLAKKIDNKVKELGVHEQVKQTTREKKRKSNCKTT